MNRYPALLSVATFALLIAASAAQNPPATDVPHQSLPVRVGPPPASASPQELEKQADELRANKTFADALDYYRAALKKNPSAGLWNKIGITELQLGRNKEAAKSFERSMKMDPNFPEAHNNRGAVYYITGAQKAISAERKGKGVPGGALKDYRKAIKEYQKALALNEENASYHSNLGTAYFSLKDFPAAMTEYARAIQLDPNIFERRSQTGIAAHLSSPEDRAHYSFVLARMYAQAGKLDQALEYLRKAMEDGYKDIDSVYKDQEFATLRKDKRFSELMNRKPVAIPQ